MNLALWMERSRSESQLNGVGFEALFHPLHGLILRDSCTVQKCIRLSLPKTRIGWFSPSYGFQRLQAGKRSLPPVPSMSRLSGS